MKFLGSPYPIIKHPRGLLRTQNGVNQIKSDLLVLLLTNPGERCLAGDTSIPLAIGKNYQIKDLIDMPPFWVYSFDIKNNTIVAGLATAHKTIENAELLEITLDNDEKVKCTTNHLWMLRNGEYKRADELEPGTSLMPLYRNKNTSGYERIYQPNIQNYRETHLSFVDGKRLSGIREVVHHKDLNKLNNSPDNLQWMTCQDHKELHKIIRNAFDEKMKSDPEFAENWKKKQKEGLRLYYLAHDGNRNGAILSDATKSKLSKSRINHFNSKNGEKTKELLRIAASKQFSEKGHPSLGRKHDELTKKKMNKPHPSMSGDNNPSKRPEVRAKLKAAWAERRLKLKNHKVKEIRKLEHREDCYDLHVEKYHNFAISAGVFVHNCMLPEYGTPLRKLIFEPNDSTIADTAREMIIKSITTWEPRITVQQIEVSTNIDPSSLDKNDTKDEIEHILSIRIIFFDPENIQDVQQLKLEVPLTGGQ